MTAIVLQILVWPEKTGAYVAVTFGLILVSAFFIWLFLKSIRDKEKKQSYDKNAFHQFALKKGLTPEEWKAVDAFVEKIDPAKALELLTNKRKLRSALFTFMARDPHALTSAHALGKLFNRRLNITRISDLQIGEIGAIQIDGAKYVCRVDKITGSALELFCPSYSLTHKLESLSAVLHTFRPPTLPYVLSGTIQKVEEQHIVFEHSGVVGTEKLDHQMAIWELPVSFVSWSLRLAVQQSKSKPILQKKEELIEVALKANTKKISTRGITIHPIRLERHLTEGMEPYKPKDDSERHSEELRLKEAFKKSPFWEVHLDLPSGYHLVSKGRLFASTMRRGEMIFRFIEPPELAMNILDSEIKEHNPVPEQMG